ncbi:MAG: EAL domain-containing protein [Desulfobacterales bacterium]
MTLFRQLILFTLVLFFLLFTGSWLVKLSSTRTFLIDQLESHAQDTATSLGLSITLHIDDEAMIETMVNAVFDQGYYQYIRVIDTQDHVIINRVLPIEFEKVPQWFIRLVDLSAPEAEAHIMSGWLHAGTVYVKSHPGYAYKTLWEDVVRMTVWFALCGIVVLTVGGAGIRILLRPLKRVQHQAEALSNRQYEIQKKLPRTRELRSVVETMNKLTRKVKEMFEEQASYAHRLREHAYSDSLTGLGNRRYFKSQINARLDRRDSDTKNVLLLIQLNDLQQLNIERGFQAGDALLKRTADLLRECTKTYPNSILARLTGGDFSIFIPDAAFWDAESIAKAVTGRLSRLFAENAALTDNIGHVGASVHDIPTTPARLMAEADLALRTAQKSGPNMWEIRAIKEASEKMPLGQQGWKELIRETIHRQNIHIYAQPVVRADDRQRVIHKEVFSKISTQGGELISAGIFLPFSERFGMISAIDRMVLANVMTLAGNEPEMDPVAVNVSPTSLLDREFTDWIAEALAAFPSSMPRIHFEFSEYGAIQQINRVKEFGSLVRRYGHALGLDHYGQSFTKLGYLQSLRPDYVKIDRAYTGELKSEDNDSRFFIGSLCSVAHSLDILVVAEGVEDEQQSRILQDLNIDGIQGYVIAKPERIGTS